MLIKNPVQPTKKAEKSGTAEPKKTGQLFSVTTDLGVTAAPKAVKTPKAKAIPDDSIEVAQRIKQLFAKYEKRYQLVTTEEELIEYMVARPELGFDTETNGKDSVWFDNLVGFSIGNDKDCIYVPLFHEKGQNYTGDLDRLKEILTGGGRKYWGMNTKFDRSQMKIWAGKKYEFLRDPAEVEARGHKYATSAAGFDIPMCWDAEIGARLLDNRDLAALKPQYIKYIDPDEEFYDYKSLFKQKFSKYDPAVVGIYGGVDAIKHYILGKYQEKKMREHFPRIYKLMKNVELPLIEVVMDMEMKGIAIDREYYAQFTAALRSEVDAKLAEIQRDFPGFNPNSPKQVGEVLFDRLRLPDVSKKRQTGEEFLAKMHHPIPKLILEIRKLTKSISTYTEAIPGFAIDDENGIPIVHTTYHTIGADTGRFSSSGPNLQNQPKDNRFRRGFVARPGHKLVSCDFSQQEQAILAGGSQDPRMLEGANSGRDYYALMASIIWDLPYEECTKKGKHKHLRNRCKSIVLGVTYGMGSKSLAESLNNDSSDHVYTVEECDRILEKFYAGFPYVKKFQEDCAEFGTKYGYMETVLGRRRYFKYLGGPAFDCPDHPEVADTLNKLKYYNQIRACLDEARAEGIEVYDNRWNQTDELRQTCNQYCQGSAADQTKVCMIALFRDPVFREKYHGQILLQVHDELIAEFPEELAVEGGKYMADVMSEVGSEVGRAKIWCEPEVMEFWQKS
jgi:DNA polymerase I-like protein with 3'-5' exonuclease and polymerase domains